MKIGLVQFSSELDGSAISGQILVRGLLARGWQVSVAFANEGPVLEQIRGLGAEVAVLPHKNWLRRGGWFHFGRDWWAERRAATGFVDWLSRLQPDAVYLNTLASFAGADAAHRLGLPTIWHARELFVDGGGELHWPSGVGRALVRKLFRSRAQGLVANSKAVADNVFGAGLRDSVSVVPNAVADSFFKPRTETVDARRKLGLPEGVPVVGVPATFRAVKGHRFFLVAVPEILRRVPDCCFALTGDASGGLGKELIDEMKGASFGNRVRFLGRVEQMETFYHACDVACVPSRGEPFGRTAIECLASQTPVVVTSVGGLKEIIQHDRNGLSVDYGDVEGLKNSVVSLLHDSDRASRLSRQGLVDARRCYTERAYTDRLAEIIERTVAARR